MSFRKSRTSPFILEVVAPIVLFEEFGGVQLIF
jgi:hypothetical protein